MHATLSMRSSIDREHWHPCYRKHSQLAHNASYSSTTYGCRKRHFIPILGRPARLPLRRRYPWHSLRRKQSIYTDETMQPTRDNYCTTVSQMVYTSLNSRGYAKLVRRAHAPIMRSDYGGFKPRGCRAPWWALPAANYN